MKKKNPISKSQSQTSSHDSEEAQANTAKEKFISTKRRTNNTTNPRQNKPGAKKK